MSDAGPGFFERVYAVVRGIPRGRVATYGQVAAMLGVPRGARAVGWALRGIGRRAATLPWHRVVGAFGRISLDGRPSGELQRRRLRLEGVRFVNGHVDLSRHGLTAPPRTAQQAVSGASFHSTLTRGSRSVSLARWRTSRAVAS